VLGHGTYASSDSPAIIEALAEENVCKIAVGWSHTIALTVDGKVFEWGNAYKDLDAAQPDMKTPVQIVELHGKIIGDIAAGNYHSLALKTRGRTAVYTWGGNGYG
jgi:alpha-tubulin suppressor-like RCC1 family protein